MSADEDWNTNFLIVRLIGKIGGLVWTARKVSMVSQEVEEIAEWLEALPDTEREPPLATELQSDLRFEKLSEQSIRISLVGRAAPPRAGKGVQQDQRSFEVPIDERLKQAAAQLRMQLKDAKAAVRIKIAKGGEPQSCLRTMLITLVGSAILLFFAWFSSISGEPWHSGDFVLGYIGCVFLWLFGWVVRLATRWSFYTAQGQIMDDPWKFP